MFKELKVIKLLIFSGLLTLIILKLDFSKMVIVDLYTDQVSYLPGSASKIYASSAKTLKTKVSISGITNSIESEINLNLNPHKTNYHNVLESGLKFPLFTEYTIPKNLKSGIYLINELYPLIVKSNSKADITVVYPAMNNLLYTHVNKKAAYDVDVKRTSLLRTVCIDKYSLGFAEFIKTIDNEYTINYITDLDLENVKNITSNTIIIYGKSTYWTAKMRNAILQFEENGGNILDMTSYLTKNICSYKNNHTISLTNEFGKKTTWAKTTGFTKRSFYGLGYNTHTYSNNNNYFIKNNSHPIFKGLNSDTIKVAANLYSSPLILWRNENPKIDLGSMNFYKGKVLAYGKSYYKNNSKHIKGIFVLQADSLKGKIVSLGSEDWCLRKNIIKNKHLQIITKNAIDYLVKSKKY